MRLALSITRLFGRVTKRPATVQTPPQVVLIDSDGLAFTDADGFAFILLE
jgi:hypothetical protein